MKRAVIAAVAGAARIGIWQCSCCAHSQTGADACGVTLAGDVRNADVWCSGTFEHRIKVSSLLTAAEEPRLSYLGR